MLLVSLGHEGVKDGRFEKDLEDWVQSQMNENAHNSIVSVEPTDEHQGESAGIDRKRETQSKVNGYIVA